MKNLIKTFLTRLFEKPVGTLPTPWRLAAVPLRLLRALVADVSSGQLTLRAGGLVYTTLLSLVPFLALSFSVLKAFGVHNQVRPTLTHFLEPLGAKGVEIAGQVIGFVERVNVGVLGAVGLAVLVFTAVSLVQKIEGALNHVWHVRRGRSLAQRFSGYLSVIVLAPVLGFAAAGLSATVMEHSLVRDALGLTALSWLAEGVGKIMPLLILTTIFTLVYVLIPNTRVRLLPAISGGFLAAILWKGLGLALGLGVLGTAKYDAIYSGFAGALMFMLWLYLNWLVVLLGAAVAYYAQNPAAFLTPRRRGAYSPLVWEEGVLALLGEIVRRHEKGLPPLSLPRLAEVCGLTIDRAEDMLAPLAEAGIVVAARRAVTLAHAPKTVPLIDVWRLARGAGSPATPLMKRLEAAVARELKKDTLADLKQP